VLHAARCKYRTQKSRQKSPSGHHRTTLSGYIFSEELSVSDGSGRLIWAPWLRLAGSGLDVVATRYAAATLSGRGARVYTCTYVHDNIPCRRLAK